MIEKLNKMFIARYSKELSELNKNVYISPKNDKGNFEVPVPTLGELGGTVQVGSTEAFTLNSPALVKVDVKEMKPTLFIYRVAFPLSECEIAAEKPEYFNYLFDGVMLKAIDNYRATVGDENKVRFGTHYISYTLPDGSVFRDAGEYLEVRLHGDWASNESVEA